ncbi:MAG TPA: chalcone isomerase family protein [Burkholderiaceae bacterium]|jgi:hypothetical protein
MRRLLIAAIASLAVLGARAADTGPVSVTNAPVVEVAGVKYNPVEEVGGQKLQLNGAGVRYKAIFKVYAAGLYLTGKATTPEAVIAMPGPKRLHIVALRDLDGNDLGKLFYKGMESNTTREEFVKAINGVLKIGELFATKKELKKGESFSVDYLPGTGSVVLINGVRAGEVIKEPEFYGAFLHVWLGPNPPDSSLKAKLLGGAKN